MSNQPADRMRRWPARPAAAATLNVLAFLIPTAASGSVAYLAGRLLPPPQDNASLALWWVIFVGASLVTLIAFDRLARRLIPLTVLLKLTLVFPDRAPSRLAVARRAGRVRDLKKKVQAAKEQGIEDEPTAAATTVLALVAALSAHDRLTRGHSERVRAFIDMLASELPLSTEDRDRLRWAGLLHDIGKLAVSPDILNKPGRPDPQEWDQIRRHPIEGARLATPLLPFLGEWAGTIEHHHERFDGSGYPHGLSGEAITQGGRIAAVADAYEVMTAARPYKKPMNAEEGRAELARCSGTHFDPSLVRAFLNISVGRLWRAIGLVSWLAQFPVFRRLAYRGYLNRYGWGFLVALAAVLGLGLLAVTGALALPFAEEGRIIAEGGGAAGEPIKPDDASGENGNIIADPLDTGEPKDPDDARGEVNGNIVTVTWSHEPTASAYSLEWNQTPESTPDTQPDLSGDATSATSPELDPGDWYFHMTTQGEGGSWTATIHLGPFTISRDPSLGRLEGSWEVRFVGAGSEGDLRATDHTQTWTLLAQCREGPCDTKQAERSVLFGFAGGEYRGQFQEELPRDCRAVANTVSIQFRVVKAELRLRVWRAIEISGVQTQTIPPQPDPRFRCPSGVARWNLSGRRVS